MRRIACIAALWLVLAAPAGATHKSEPCAGHSIGFCEAQVVKRAGQVRSLRRTLQASSFSGFSWVERAFIHCIYPKERGRAGWQTRTGNGYYGGLQMDLDFQRSYGSEFLSIFGLAHRWPPSVQVAVAMRAYHSGRGFHPWPRTARACGLI